jgi:hypothetical protein
MDTFIEVELSKAVDSLSHDAQPLWGTMNSSEMLDHLQGSLDLTFYNGDIKILTPPDKLAASRTFILSEKPLPRGAVKPEVYKEVKSSSSGFEDRKKSLVHNFQKYAREMMGREDFKATHPYFGELNGPEWVHFQKKHFRHHLAQFGLMERDQPL